MLSQPTARRLAGLLVLGLGLCAVLPSHGQTPDTDEDRADEAKPVGVSAGKAVRWTEGESQVLLLRDGVSIERGLLRIRASQAVIWLDTNETREGRPLPVLIYAEEASVERDGKESKEAKLLTELRTTGDFRLSFLERTEQNAADDPLYQKGVAHRLATRKNDASSDAPIRVTRGESPPTRAVPTQGAEPPAGAPLAPPPPPDPPSPPAGLGEPPGPVPQPGPPAEVGPPPRPVSPPLPPQVPRWRATPRGSSGINVEGFRGREPEEFVYVLTGGVSFFVEDAPGIGLVDISADRIVLWTRNVDNQRFITGLQSGEARQEHVEVYLEGHVEIRQASTSGPHAGNTRLLLADQAYYDVSRSVAVIINGELIARQPSFPVPVHVKAEQIRQVAPNRFEADNVLIWASRLPSDPGVTVAASRAAVTHLDVPVRGLFGRPLTNPAGQPLTTLQLLGETDDFVLRLGDVPVFYLPHTEGDLTDPLGPLDRIRFRQDRIFGFGLLLDWDVYQLLGATRAPDGTKWTIGTDFLSERGPALGTDFTSQGADLFNIPGLYSTVARGYLIHDRGDEDDLGGDREFDPPKDVRGRFLFRHRQEIGTTLTFWGQVSYLSDRNFLEQYFRREFQEDVNQETFVYGVYQSDNFAASVLVEPRIRSWVTETEWLPRADAYLLGQSFFNRFTYFAHASGGYAVLRPTSDIPQGFVETPVPGEFDRVRPLPPASDFPHTGRIETGRLDLVQELDWPFELGPVKVVPFGLLDITHYTDAHPLHSPPFVGDEDDGATRLYGGGGVRASIPFTRVFPDVHSDIFYLRGLAHKIVFDAEYRYVASDVDFRRLPELDRLNDDATDQAMRDLRARRLLPLSPAPSERQLRERFLGRSPLFDPQLYAIRHGLSDITGPIDTRDDLEVLRLGVRQRLQTKRGLPGREHIVDWMTLDVEASFFPNGDRDNFGESFGLLMYDYTWHVGDRTTLLSNGWFEPVEHSQRVFNIGMLVDRPDRSNFFLGYRMADPIGSDTVIAASSYVFSPKYAMTLSSSYDFGDSRALGNSLIITRIGTDLQVSVGFNYEALRNNFGIFFEILPSLAPRLGGVNQSALLNGGRGGL